MVELCLRGVMGRILFFWIPATVREIYDAKCKGIDFRRLK